MIGLTQDGKLKIDGPKMTAEQLDRYSRRLAGLPVERPVYPGGKHGNGVWQNLINLIPPHDRYIAAFSGLDAVGWEKLPAAENVFLDLHAEPLEVLAEHFHWTYGNRTHRFNFRFVKADSIEWLRFTFRLSDVCNVPPPRDPAQKFGDGEWESTFVLADPPYPHNTRVKTAIYEHEMSDADHVRLLEVMTALPCPCIVCSYKNELYESRLKNWTRLDYQNCTRGGPRTESVWLNYPPPSVLHDSRFLGSNKRERERIRRRIRNWTAALNRADPLERQAIVDAIRRHD